MNEDIDLAEIRRRQRGRAVIMAWLLGGFVILVFAIAIVRIKGGM
jgi:hypothetical protein